MSTSVSMCNCLRPLRAFCNICDGRKLHAFLHRTRHGDGESCARISKQYQSKAMSEDGTTRSHDTFKSASDALAVHIMYRYK